MEQFSEKLGYTLI